MTGIPHDTSADRDPDARGEGSDDRLVGSLVALADRATADLPHDHRLSPDAVLATRAAALGRRRLRIRSATRAGGVLVAASVLTAGALTLPPEYVSRVPVVGSLVGPAEVDTGFDRYAHLLDRPTRGGLAADQAFRARAFAAWATAADVSTNRHRRLFDDLRGEPHLVWAGQTAAGPAAVVVQRADVHAGDGVNPLNAGPQTLIGYLATGADGTLRFVDHDWTTTDTDTAPDPESAMTLTASWLDPDRRILLFVDQGFPLEFSTRQDYHPDGSVTRVWQPVSFTDGAAVVDLPDDVDLDLVRVARTPRASYWDVQRIGGYYRSGGAPDSPRFPWASDEPMCVTPTAWKPTTFACADWGGALEEARRERIDPGADTEGIRADPAGTVIGRTPDGRTFVVATEGLGRDRSRVLGGVLTGTGPKAVTGSALVDAGVLDPDAALPVAVRLPERQGWVVANVGATLRYRATSSDAWTDAGADAALLPDAATLQVEVTPAGGRPEVVTLGG